MLGSELFPFVEGILRTCMGSDTSLKSVEALGGGCINQTFKVITDSGDFFLKWNEDGDHFFRNEVRGLRLLHAADALSVPEILGEGIYDSRSYLLMDYIKPGYANTQFWEHFGAQLATLHRIQAPNGQYGLDHDNEIGRLKQKNDWKGSWIDFFIESRLEIQLTLAYYNDLIDKGFMNRFRMLYDQLPSILVNNPPSLIHGDLWSGNYLVGKDSLPVLIDPAMYYANREIEMAYTQLFGGFDPLFYQSYQSTWPLQEGFPDRADLYNLYPLLVHLNLFGRSYLSSIEQTLRRYL